MSQNETWIYSGEFFDDDGIKVFVNGAEWTSVIWKNTGKIQLTGSIKAAVPKGTPTDFKFLNPDGGSVEIKG